MGSVSADPAVAAAVTMSIPLKGHHRKTAKNGRPQTPPSPHSMSTGRDTEKARKEKRTIRRRRPMASSSMVDMRTAWCWSRCHPSIMCPACRYLHTSPSPTTTQTPCRSIRTWSNPTPILPILLCPTERNNHVTRCLLHLPASPAWRWMWELTPRRASAPWSSSKML